MSLLLRFCYSFQRSLRADPNDTNIVYCEMRYGRITRVDLATGARQGVSPQPPRGTRYRFNWKTPFMLSHHNSKIFYCAGNYVFRSLDRGSNPQRISPEITRTDKGSATALAESPRDPNVLYVGTDDGALWVTRDGGTNWTNVAEKVGLPGNFHVASIEASRFEAARCYVAFDGHRSNNDDPHLYVTEDFGQTWKCLNANLPSGSSRVLREDVANENLLYAGTEFAIWATLDRGESWNRINNNLPTVAVHEIAVHPTAGEIAVATHGRSMWILDVTPLRQMSDQVVKAKAHLFQSPAGVLWAGALSGSFSGHKQFAGRNPEFGSAIHYYLSTETKQISLEIRDIKGEVVRRLNANGKPGLHRVQWDLRGEIRRSAPTAAEREANFRRLDMDNDGALTDKDAPEGPRGESFRRFIERADKDEDGEVSLEEYHEDQSSAAEPPQRQIDREALFGRLDRDEDGALTEKDAVGQFSEFIRVLLNRADQDKDGKVTVDEFKAADLPSGGANQRQRLGPPVRPGTYLAKLTVDGDEFLQEILVESDPEFPAALLMEELEELYQKESPDSIE